MPGVVRPFILYTSILNKITKDHTLTTKKKKTVCIRFANRLFLSLFLKKITLKWKKFLDSGRFWLKMVKNGTINRIGNKIWSTP